MPYKVINLDPLVKHRKFAFSRRNFVFSAYIIVNLLMIKLKVKALSMFVC